MLAAFADPGRLQLLGRLVAAPASNSELTAFLGCTKAELGAQLSVLGGAGLIRMERTADGERVALRAERLEEIATLTRASTPQPAATYPGASEDDLRVLASYLRGERLTTIPAQRKKLLVILRYLVERFEHGRDYPEPEVNDLLRVAHPDFATLRRDLIDFGFMVRSAGIYRRVDRSADYNGLADVDRNLD